MSLDLDEICLALLCTMAESNTLIRGLYAGNESVDGIEPAVQDRDRGGPTSLATGI